MNEETAVSNIDTQEKPIENSDDNASLEPVKKIEIVAEVTNILDNLVKKTEKSNSSDDEENGNIFKTESKVNDIEKSESESPIENKDENEDQNEEVNNEISNDNAEAKLENVEDKKDNVEEQNETDEKDNVEEQNETDEKDKVEAESATNDTVDSIFNEPSADSQESNLSGTLESIVHNKISSLVDGKVDISTETDHRERKVHKKNKVQDTTNQPEQADTNNDNGDEYSDKQLQNALDAMLKKKILPDIKMRPSVINYARRICNEKMINEEYDEAINIDTAIDVMFTSMEGTNTDPQKQQMNENVLQRLQMTKGRKEEVEKRWDDKITEQKNINSQKLAELVKTHEKEKSAFVEEWNNPQALVAFSKPSAKLFHLRKQQKTLALVHDFEGAKILKNEADQLEKIETSEGLRKAENSMKNQYMALLDRQKREMACLVDNSKMSIEKLEMQKYKELCSIENTEKVLQSRLISSPGSNSNSSSKKNKLIMNPTVIVPNVNSNSAMRSRSLNSSMMISRPRSQVTSYKAVSETWRLKLKLNDINKTIRLVEPVAKNKQNSTL
ncbi:hypothetical protein M9Y10_020196 [Tritrichomonas musculus]|uniref:Uncharacterized protein n=1 Tax=Tritrichomonas musculus TaxID=1915356 RepID=A0ABR2HFJ5_9EUKA